MSIHLWKTTAARYEDILSFENEPEIRERYQKEAEFIAFYTHLQVLGENKDVTPELFKGNTTISVPAFFSLEEYSDNPVNAAALELVPNYSYEFGYGNTVMRNQNSGIDESLWMHGNELRAARRGDAVKFIVANSLGLIDEVTEETYKIVKPYSNRYDSASSRVRDAGELVDGVQRDLDENVVREVSEMASMVEQKGYTDFLDYLVDTKQVISSRVATIFDHESLKV